MAVGFQVRIGARWTTAPRRRRAWIGADGLTWTARNGIVRWCWRTSDTKRNHNSTRYGREGFTYAGKDCNTGLVASSKIGGETSLRARMDAGVVTTAIRQLQRGQAIRARGGAPALADVAGRPRSIGSAIAFHPRAKRR